MKTPKLLTIPADNLAFALLDLFSHTNEDDFTEIVEDLGLSMREARAVASALTDPAFRKNRFGDMGGPYYEVAGRIIDIHTSPAA